MGPAPPLNPCTCDAVKHVAAPAVEEAFRLECGRCPAQVPGSYYVKGQDGDLKCLLVFPNPEVRQLLVQTVR